MLNSTQKVPSSPELKSPAELTVSVCFSLQESYRLVLPHVKNTILSFTAAAYLFYWLSTPILSTILFFLVLWENLNRRLKHDPSTIFLFPLHSLCSLLFKTSLNEITLSFHPLFILDFLCDSGLFSSSCFLLFLLKLVHEQLVKTEDDRHI